MSIVTRSDDGVESRELRTAGSGAPLFVFVQNDVFERLELEPLELDGDGPPITMMRHDPARVVELRTLQGMAARLVRRIRRLQPSGPYRLAGFHDAGVLTYEVAVQIHAADEAVEIVGLVESRCFDRRTWRARFDGTRACPIQRALTSYDAPRSPLVLHVLGAIPDAGYLGWDAVVPPGALRVLDSRPHGTANATAAQLAAVCRAVSGVAHGIVSSAAGDSSVVTLQRGAPGGAGVICVPGAGATVADFLALGPQLGTHHNVCGLQARGLDDEAVFPYPTVEAAARKHVGDLRADPSFPRSVHLVGHSFGGWVAFEIARRLQEAGHDVRSVTLLDSTCPDADEHVPRECTRLEALLELVALFEESSRQPLHVDAAHLDALDSQAQIAHVHGCAVQAGVMPQRSSPKVLLAPLRALEAALRTTYRPRKSYSGAVNLVLVADVRETAGEAVRRFGETVMGWRRFTTDLRVREAEGSHLTILQLPNVASWASLISADDGFASTRRTIADGTS